MSSSSPAPTPTPHRVSIASPAPSTTVAGSNTNHDEPKPERPPIDPQGDSTPQRRASQYDIYASEPPPLDYTVKTNNRERKILLWIALLYVEAGVLPLLLFFSLRWGAHLSNTTNLAIITSLIGAVSGMKVSTRQWHLWLGKGHHTRRPIGAGRWGMDIFQVVLSMCMASFFIPLIIGSSVSPGNPRIVAMSLPCTMIVLTLPMLLTSLFPHKLKVPFRVSSLPTWQPLPPFAYFFVEDVVAVDGGGCTEFRQAWRVRYEESSTMRKHVRDISLIFGCSGVTVAIILLVTAWVAPLDTAYGLCWSMPWLWGMVLSLVTVILTNRMLVRERTNWRSEHVEAQLPFSEGKYDPPIVPLDRVATFNAEEHRRRASAPGPRPNRNGNALATVPGSGSEDEGEEGQVMEKKEPVRHDSAP
ncbi:hypothetical protein EXIGLDRAFT_723859 [Exidia glandulosa HHB12029]|uniref:Uncharacterized protein n=1 Tax=Exidia glandulosa HHB12029 TaxID=1314781 RepID=A0A165MUK1_EXIGL|nr:hypothetical protein EXIGLDRAFT_723859 [Exidia glandulosa HHB12029]